MAQSDTAPSTTSDRPRQFRSLFPIVLLAIGVLALGWTRSPAADKPASADPSGLTRREALERFHKLSPEERLTLAEKVAGGQAFVRLMPADLDITVGARGTLEPAKASDVYCTVSSGSRGSTSSTSIKWIIDEGTFVKKGDKIVELDSSGIQDQLKDKSKDVDRAHADKVTAHESLKITEAQTDLDIRSAEIALKLAKIERKKYTGTDKDQKEILDLKIEQAQLGLASITRQGKAKLATAKVEAQARDAIYEQELARKKDIEAEIAKCTVRAPQDGLVIYYVPEQVRGGGGSQQPVVAQGEPVREGQKMIRICNLEQFIVNARVHEAQISLVRVGQPVRIRVDAFPKRVLRGKVRSIATVPSAQDWLASDVKLFGVQIAITDKIPALKPGMSAEVRVEIERLTKVLQVPLESVVRIGGVTFCYVKFGKGLAGRQVKTGKRNDLVVEITGGVKENELVLRAPGVVAQSLARRTSRGPDEPAGAKVLVQSVRAQPASRMRSRVASYGLTYTDLARIRTLPDVTAVAPVRDFPADAYFLQRRISGQVIATVPEYQELTGIRLAAGRFLDEEDGEEMRNIAVLGADVAESLFPEEEPLGKVVRIGKFGYLVVGVLEEQKQPAGGLTAQEGNRGVYLPLRTARGRFGERIIVRRGGTRTAEAVQLSEILVGTRSQEQASFVADSISDILEDTHSRKDWAIRGRIARTGDPLLEVLGGLTGVHLYQSYLNIGLLADGVESELYTKKHAGSLLEGVVGALNVVDAQLERVPASRLNVSDRKRVARVRELSKLLRTLASELKLYWSTGKQEHADRFQKVRAEVRTGIKALVAEKE